MGDKVVNMHGRTPERYGNGDSWLSSPVMRGRLITLPICGLGYRTASQNGVTSCSGEFRYLQGERVTFFIGKADFPSATTGAVVTPYDMCGSSHVPINVTRLLLSMVRENNGMLSIPVTAEQLITGAIDFNVEPYIFERQPVIAELFNQLGARLVDEQTAVDHLDTAIALYIYGTYLDFAVSLWLNACATSSYVHSLDDDPTR